jgi:hypothetical protein
VIQSATFPLLDNSSSTASWGAGGLWKPSYCSDSRVTPWSMETLEELLVQHQSNRPHIEIVPTVRLRRRNDLTDSTLPEWSTKDERLQFQFLNLEMLEWQNRIHKLRFPFLNYKDVVEKHGYPYCWLFFSPIVDAPNYLKSMQEEILELASTVARTNSTATSSSSSTNDSTTSTTVFQTKQYTDLQQMIVSAQQLHCDAVVNCTGIGARDIRGTNDATLIPARGILAQYRRDCARLPFLEDGTLTQDISITITEPPFASEEEPCYLIPRGDVILVGGSCQEWNSTSSAATTTTTVDRSLQEEERYRLRRNAQLLGIDTSRADPLMEYSCFRPSRPTVRVEIDPCIGIQEGIKLVHNYGSGGSGWTVFVGQAKEAVRILLQD